MCLTWHTNIICHVCAIATLIPLRCIQMKHNKSVHLCIPVCQNLPYNVASFLEYSTIVSYIEDVMLKSCLLTL